MNVYGRCDECDRPLMWGGTRGWIEHTPENHAQDRRRLVRWATRTMQERLAARHGHTVTLWFTQEHAWAGCSCSYQGLLWPDIAYARSDAHAHLWEIGSVLYWALLNRDKLTGLDFGPRD